MQLRVTKLERTGFYTPCRAWLRHRQMQTQRLLHSMRSMAYRSPNSNAKAFTLNVEHGLQVTKCKRKGFYTKCGAWLMGRQMQTQRLLHSMRSMAYRLPNANAKAFTLNAEHGLWVAKHKCTGFYTQCREWLNKRSLDCF